jgi:hypothetical protein
LEETTEAVRRGVAGGNRRHGQQAVAVHRLEADAEPRARRRHHAGQEEGRVVVGDHHRGPAAEGLEQAIAGTALGLDVGVVDHRSPAEAAAIVVHAVEDEPVEPVARPGVVAAQRLQDHQRPTEVPGPVGGPLQSVVEGAAAGGDHPVQHPLGVGACRRRGDDADPLLRNARPHDILLLPPCCAGMCPGINPQKT